jgi:hypothetical protein
MRDAGAAMLFSQALPGIFKAIIYGVAAAHLSFAALRSSIIKGYP